MNPKSPSKLPFEVLYKSIKATLNYPEVEKAIISKVKDYVDRVSVDAGAKSLSDPACLEQYLNPSPNQNLNAIEGLRIVLQTGNLSIERMRRFSEDRFHKPLESALKSPRDREVIIDILLNKDSTYLRGIPLFQRYDFCLPNHWREAMANKDLMFRLSKATFRQKYTTAYGNALEDKIGTFITNNNLTYEKGKVSMVDNKEVDLAVPSVANPTLLIMSSYSMTTSSAQSSRANEQCSMYDLVVRHNRVHNDHVLFVNVVDGGGWSARKNDLKKMYDCCHYCYTDSTVEGLSELLSSLKTTRLI